MNTIDEKSFIKKSSKKELSKDMKEINEVINCDTDAETKCKMISDILTSKPHYFDETHESEDREMKCKYHLSEDCNGKDCLTCMLNKIKNEIEHLHYHPKLDFIKNDKVVEMVLDIIDIYKMKVSNKEMTNKTEDKIKKICNIAEIKNIVDLSDGYHTLFNQLYYQRMILFATIVNMNKDKSWKSLRHEDGELCFGGGWFIVGIDTPEGSYTYHYEDKYFDLFNCIELECGKHCDGHTEKDVVRLLSLA